MKCIYGVAIRRVMQRTSKGKLNLIINCSNKRGGDLQNHTQSSKTIKRFAEGGFKNWK